MAVPPPHLPPVPSPRDRGHKCVSTTKLALGHKPFPSAERFQGLPKPFPPHSAGLSEEKKEQHREGFRRGKLLSQGTASSLTEKPRVGVGVSDTAHPYGRRLPRRGGGVTGQLCRCGTAPCRREKAGRGGVFGEATRPAGLKMAAAGRRAAESGVMAGARVCLTLLVAALMFAGAVLAGEGRPRLLGAPVDIDNTDNDEGLQRALQFAVTEYNKASNDMYSSRVVRIISAKRQVGDGTGSGTAAAGWPSPPRAGEGGGCRGRSRHPPGSS